MNRASVIAPLFALSTLASCQLIRGKRSSKAVPAIDSVLVDTNILKQTPSADSGVAAVDTADVFLWNSLLQRPSGYGTFSGKAHATYEGGGNSQDFDLNIRIERDRRIWVSITGLLGVEGARALITPDSLKALDRIHHDAYVMSLADAGQLLPFPADFSLIQALILGEPLPTGASFAGMALVADTAFLLGKGNLGRHEIGFALKDSSLFRQDLTKEPDHITLINDRFNRIGGFRFPLLREIRASSSGLNHRVLIEFEEVQFNGPVEMNFSIPEKYKRR